MQTIAVIAAGAGVPELLAAAAFAAAVNGFIRGCMNKDRLDHACRKYSENVMVTRSYLCYSLSCITRSIKRTIFQRAQ